jgi:5-methylcytosine-specific restriction protein B
MTEQELIEFVAEAAGVPKEQVTTKVRPGTQIKANALWEGSCSPRNERKGVGLFMAQDRADIALEGALRRMTMEFPFPDSIVVLGTSDSERHADVLGYPDSIYASTLADSLEVEVSAVARPDFAKVNVEDPRFFDVEGLWANLLESPNIVLQGPPGTGKSSLALALIQKLSASANMTPAACRYGNLILNNSQKTSNNAHFLEVPVVWEFVQLHPSYSYDDLVRRIVPRTRDGNMYLTTEDSLLPQLCKIAELRGADKPVILVLDEMNRGNLASILGEFVFAIDPAHRGTAVRLQYQGPGLASAVAVPTNLWIIGTMNTADRSIAMVDYAIRRRFRFLDVPADPDIIERHFSDNQKYAKVTKDLFDACNHGLPSRLKIGHSEFLINYLPLESWPDRMARKVIYHVLPLIVEYTKEGLRDDVPVTLYETIVSENSQRAASEKLAATLRAALAEN